MNPQHNDPQTHHLLQQIHQTKTRIQHLHHQIQQQRNRRQLLDELELDGQSESEVSVSVIGDSQVKRREEVDVSLGQSGREGEDGSWVSVSSREIVDQFENIRNYMKQQIKQQQPPNNNNTNNNKQQHPSNKPNKSQQQPPYFYPWSYKSNPTQYLKTRLQYNTSININTNTNTNARVNVKMNKPTVIESNGDKLEQGSVDMSRTRKRKVIFNGNYTRLSVNQTNQLQEITRQQQPYQQIRASINKKYQQFTTKHNHPNLQPPPSFPQPSQPSPSSSSQYSPFTIIPIPQKKHIPCLQMFNRTTQKYRNILKTTNRERNRCWKLGNTIREIAVFQRIISNY